MSASAAAYILVQSLLLPSLSFAQFVFFVVGMGVLSILLYRFEPRTYEKLSLSSFPPVAILMLLGRRTLEFYVLHLVLFRAAVMFADPERFAFCDFQIFAFSQVLAFFL